MNDITAALGIVQLEKLPLHNNARLVLANKYISNLANVDWLQLPHYDQLMSWHLFAIRVDRPFKKAFIDYMLSKGISVGCHYKPLNHYEFLKKYGETPITEKVFEELVTIPLYPDLAFSTQSMIIDIIKRFQPHQ